MEQFKFKRGLDDTFVERLNQLYEDGDWWKKLVDDRGLFLAIRDDYVNLYYKGASILKLTWYPIAESIVGEIHYKYLIRPKLLGRTSPSIRVEDGNAILPDLHHIFLDTISDVSLIKRTANRYAGNEKSSVHYVAQKDSNKVFDLEVAFSEEDEESTPRMDLAALRQAGEGVEVVFFEAKEFSNHKELRKRYEENAKVVEQIQQYSRILRNNSDAIIRSYRRVCKNLHELQGVAQRFPKRSAILKCIADGSTKLTINEQPRLLIMGCDQDQIKGEKWRPHRDKLEDSFPGRVRVVGSGKSVSLNW